MYFFTQKLFEQKCKSNKIGLKKKSKKKLLKKGKETGYFLRFSYGKIKTRLYFTNSSANGTNETLH